MDTFDAEAKLQTVLLIVEALTYLALAFWCLNRSRDGRWAGVAALGAAGVGVMLGLNAASFAELQFLDSTQLLETLFFREHFSTLYTVVRVAGVLLLATGFVLSRRTPPAPTDSIHGPG